MLRKFIPSLIFLSFFVIAAGAQPPQPEPARTYYYALTAEEISDFENKLKTAPDDEGTRKKLINYYSERETPADEKALQRHRLALLKSHPETSAMYFGSWFNDNLAKPEYSELKNVWLKNIAADPKNSEIRFQAARFFSADAEMSEKILREGKIADPINTEYSVKLIELYESQYEPNYESDEAELKTQEVFLKKILAESQSAAALAKKAEQTEETAAVYRNMLAITAKSAVEIGDLPTAKSAADQLLAALGDPKMLTDNYLADDIGSFQIANSALGRIALRAGNVVKAREHLMNSLLLISRGDQGDQKIDALFLEEMLVRNGSKNVIEYLELYIKPVSFDELTRQRVRETIAALNRGKIPGFGSLSALY